MKASNLSNKEWVCAKRMMLERSRNSQESTEECFRALYNYAPLPDWLENLILISRESRKPIPVVAPIEVNIRG